MFYEINTHERLLTIDLVGPVTTTTIIELVRRARNDSRYSTRMKVFFDVSRCDLSSISTAQIRQLISLASEANSTSKVAIYAPDDLAYGMARIYVSEASLKRERPRQVFKDYHSATKWLASDED